MYKKKTICLNCDLQGHSFKRCKLPIRSYGIIAVNKDNHFLLIQRKDTIGYTDFLRGKYTTKDGKVDMHKLNCLIYEMTEEEKKRLLEHDFEYLWDFLWLGQKSGLFNNEKQRAKQIFEEGTGKREVKLSQKSRYSDTEWGFPKGRKNLHELAIQCATREFKEETGLKDKDFTIVSTKTQYIEDFTGSDGVSYSHIYYIARIHDNVELDKVVRTEVFKQEVKDMGFFDYKSAYNLFRDYDTQKKRILTEVNDLLN